MVEIVRKTVAQNGSSAADSLDLFADIDVEEQLEEN